MESKHKQLISIINILPLLLLENLNPWEYKQGIIKLHLVTLQVVFLHRRTENLAMTRMYVHYMMHPKFSKKEKEQINQSQRS